MVLAHFSVISLGAQHIARSVLPFLPHNIPLVSQYKSFADKAISVTCGHDKEWPAALMVLRHSSPGVQSVAFSPDGRRLASASYRTIWIWDSLGGSCLVTLMGHLDFVESVAFSPDGQRLTSGGMDTTGMPSVEAVWPS